MISNICPACGKSKSKENLKLCCSLECEKIQTEKYLEYCNIKNVKLQIIKMKDVICIICGSTFKSPRNSKLCCSPECEKIRSSNYYSNRYIEFRNSDRKKKREMLIEKYSISSSNLYKLKYICEECETTFYYDYSIYESFNNTFVSNYNVTPWGVPCCPRCGLVEKSILDELPIQCLVMTEVDRKLFLANLHRCKLPLIKKQAIYMRNVIDFISEAEEIRKQRNRINDIGKLTQTDINLCISRMFEVMK